MWPIGMTTKTPSEKRLKLFEVSNNTSEISDKHLFNDNTKLGKKSLVPQMLWSQSAQAWTKSWSQGYLLWQSQMRQHSLLANFVHLHIIETDKIVLSNNWTLLKSVLFFLRDCCVDSSMFVPYKLHIAVEHLLRKMSLSEACELLYTEIFSRLNRWEKYYIDKYCLTLTNTVKARKHHHTHRQTILK